jgi:mRNA interferase RelE/StbE
MTYKLAFKKSALKEWEKLGHMLKEQFKKRLKERLENPHVPTAALSGGQNLYKIKLRQQGYRLVYLVADEIVTVTVIAVGKRDRNEVYEIALSRLNERQ